MLETGYEVVGGIRLAPDSDQWFEHDKEQGVLFSEMRLRVIW
jgi:hypothetical protein